MGKIEEVLRETWFYDEVDEIANGIYRLPMVLAPILVPDFLNFLSDNSPESEQAREKYRDWIKRRAEERGVQPGHASCVGASDAPNAPEQQIRSQEGGKPGNAQVVDPAQPLRPGPTRTGREAKD